MGTRAVLMNLVFKEVIQPQVPLRLPCYDFTPVINHKVVSVPPKVRLPTSFAANSHGVTGGVYKARERIHRGNSDPRLLACLLYTSPSPRDKRQSRMPSSA